MLWRVSGTNLFLLGTVHALDVSPPPLSDEAKRAISNAKRFIFECDISQPRDDSLAMLPAGESLSRMISPQLWSEIKKFSEGHGVSLNEQVLDRYPPWFVVQESRWIVRESLGFKKGSSVDGFLLNTAKKRQIPTAFLESQADGQATPANAPMNEQIEELTGFLKSPKHDILKEIGVVNLWKERNTAGLSEWVHNKLQESPEFWDRAIRVRNQKWMPKLLEFARGEIPTVASVGVMHFFGPGALQRLFKQDGLQAIALDHSDQSNT